MDYGLRTVNIQAANCKDDKWIPVTISSLFAVASFQWCRVMDLTHPRVTPLCDRLISLISDLWFRLISGCLLLGIVSIRSITCVNTFVVFCPSNMSGKNALRLSQHGLGYIFFFWLIDCLIFWFLCHFPQQNMWIERTTYTTAYKLPGILRWFEVKSVSTVSTKGSCARQAS